MDEYFYLKMELLGVLVCAVGIGAFAGFGGFDGKRKALEGTVKEEFGTAHLIVEARDGTLGNNPGGFEGNLNYGVVLDVDGRDYVISIGDYIYKPVISLAKAIEKGDRIRIYEDFSTRIYKDNIGSTLSSQVELIDKAR